MALIHLSEPESKVSPGRNAAGIALAAVALASTALASPAAALDTYSVSSNLDGAPGSLRALMSIANSDGRDSLIELPPGALLELDICGADVDEDANAEGDLDVLADGDLTIHGNGATIMQTCAGQRVVHSLNPGVVELYGVTITGGDLTVGRRGGDGGGINSEAGTVIIGRSTVAGNSAANSGGGVASHAAAGSSVDLLIVDSTISNNAARYGGGVAGLGSGQIVNSTVTSNDALDDGGGVSFPDVAMQHVTIADNGTGSTDLAAQISAYFTGTAVAIGPSIDGGPNCAPGIPVTSGGYNLSSDDSCGFTHSTDLENADPMLDGLAANGGATPTHLPIVDSPLIDRIPLSMCDATWVADQRNVSRPQGGGCDTGAVEVDATLLESAYDPGHLAGRPTDVAVAVAPSFTG